MDEIFLQHIALGVFLGALVILVVACLIAPRTMMALVGIILVPQNAVAIVNKKFTFGGARLPDGRLVALNGEAGIQADTLPPGMYFGYWRWQYEITLQPFIGIKSDQVGIVEARDGQAIPVGRVLAASVACDSFQDARSFLSKGGQRGPQIAVVPPGSYRINTALFNVQAAAALDVPENKIGIVTTSEGEALPVGDIAAAAVDGHGGFQDGQAFVNRGGWKGLQEQVLLAGRYFINPRFATVELQDLTTIPLASVGVVVSFVGPMGHDVTGEDFKHGNIVSRGERGVWMETLDPGRYPINPFTHRVEVVPTANIVLNWADSKTESHNLDKDLSTITVRSSDGFTFNLDVSQIIHVPRNDAPKVIARFGNIQNLVTQVLEPTIGNYFRNAAQSSDVIAFLSSRQERQAEAKEQIGRAVNAYNVQAVDTLIGDITPPAALMETLTDRKIATQRKETFTVQQGAEENRQKLEQARAMADTQPSVVTAERTVQVETFKAAALVAKANGEASQVKIAAAAQAEATTVNGAAEATRTLAIGTAEADVIKRKIESMDAGNYAGVEIARALSESGQKLVPDIIAGGGENGSGLINVLLAKMVTNGAGKHVG